MESRASERAQLRTVVAVGADHPVTAVLAGPDDEANAAAAQTVAEALGRDLVQIDLGRLVSTYLGETERNLRRVFDRAEENGAVLLFDEADALFGKRSEVQDAHDRYADAAVSYLLQRLETFAGVVLVRTRACPSEVNAAALARLTMVVHLPPDRPGTAD